MGASEWNPKPWKGRANKGFEGGQMELAFPYFGLSLESKRQTSGVHPNNTEDLIYLSDLFETQVSFEWEW
jgi:hypothetical protein